MCIEVSEAFALLHLFNKLKTLALIVIKDPREKRVLAGMIESSSCIFIH
jgi:hypothetical protein